MTTENPRRPNNPVVADLKCTNPMPGRYFHDWIYRRHPEPLYTCVCCGFEITKTDLKRLTD